MRRLSTILVYLTLALWLPATQHCMLEAAGLVAATCGDGCGAGQDGKKDACGTVESGAYKPVISTLKAPAPDLILCASYLCSHLVHSEVRRVLATLPGGTADRPKDWVTTWHFVRRAAPAPRAPSVFLA